MVNLYEYSTSDVIREKYAEYGYGAEYFVAYGKNINNNGKPFISIDANDLPHFMHLESDIFRSFLDRDSNLLVFDVEKYSKRYPNKTAENINNSTYIELEPLDKCISDLLGEMDINPLTIATGQGYHYAFLSPNNSLSHKMLEEIGAGGLRPDVEAHYSPHLRKHRRPISFQEATAFNGSGKLLEFLSHEIIKRAPYYGCHGPINIGDITTYNLENDGINLDLSCFEAPIHMRDIRCPFTTHQKQKIKPGGNRNNPIRVAIPRNIPDCCNPRGNGFKLSLDDVARLRENYEDAKNYARSIKMEIPNCDNGIVNMINAYKNSKLGEFHAAFDQSNDESNLFEIPELYSSDLLAPTQLRQITKIYFNEFRDHPEVARQLSKKIANIQEQKNWADFNFSKYPSLTKANFWIRTYWGLEHCNVHTKDR